MNIEHALVRDRRKWDVRGERPILVVQIDELPVSTNRVEKKVSGELTYTSAKYGPFIEFSVQHHSQPQFKQSNHFGPSPSGRYNKVFSDGFAPIVDVVLVHEGLTIEGNWGMQLRRARTLLKKYQLPWRLLLSDHDGVKGLMSWVPVETPLACTINGLYDLVHCDSVHIETVVTIQGVDYPLCARHRVLHNKQQAEQRAASASR